MPVRRKTSKIANEILSILGQDKNPNSIFYSKFQGNKEVVISETIKKYKLKERRVQFLMSSLEKKSGSK